MVDIGTKFLIGLKKRENCVKKSVQIYDMLRYRGFVRDIPEGEVGKKKGSFNGSYLNQLTVSCVKSLKVRSLK